MWTPCARRWLPNATTARKWARSALELLLPRYCVLCAVRLPDEQTRLACGACWSRMPRLASPQCERCGYPSPDTRCRWCPLLPAYVRSVRSVAWVPEGVGGELVHAMKYGGWWRLADEIGERMSRLSFPPDVVAERRMIVPVPLAPRRERERGFNQSAMLAGVLARNWSLPLRQAVQRSHFRTSQTRLTPEERLRNVAGAFRVAESAALRGAHVMLVDDVVTTAATLNECAAALFAGGARIISYVTFGRARLPGDEPR